MFLSQILLKKVLIDADCKRADISHVFRFLVYSSYQSTYHFSVMTRKTETGNNKTKRPKTRRIGYAREVKMAKTMNKDKNLTIDEVCQTLNISRATFYRYLSLEGS